MALSVAAVAEEKNVLFRAPDSLGGLQRLIDDIEEKYSRLFLLSPQFDRKLVSFQANKNSPVYRLFKYKEGFSAALVAHFIDHLDIGEGPVLDPFGGTGTTSIVSASRGVPSAGIELLPVGNLIARSRLEIARGLSDLTLRRLRHWKDQKPWKTCRDHAPLPALRITRDAYPPETEESVAQFLHCANEEAGQAGTILLFALCAILEDVSYTRKDGQYLRWDYRSKRRAGKKPFNKGAIHAFDEAVQNKLRDIIEDSAPAGRPALFPEKPSFHGDVKFIDGSCLSAMQDLDNDSFRAVITSPPYCNRYDYTRTYALELAVLGVDEKGISDLRQTMLSCTVENRSKDLLAINGAWSEILSYCDEHPLLCSIHRYLTDLKSAGELNNNGIPRMVNGYFREMACVIHESARVLKRGGHMLMVNDNVRYAGVPVPVDAILSDIAGRCGLVTDRIMVLPSSKGNSSQQMGLHGRCPLRKCIYAWRKP